jgi:hypothetical protein
MALVTVPLRAEPSQALGIVLGGQNVSLRFYTRDYLGAPRLFCDLAVDGTMVWLGHICNNLQDLTFYSYLPFSGVLRFVDLQGDAEPQWEGLGTRWVLLYGSESDWEALSA